MTCPSEGSLSLLALVPGGQVADWDGDPAEPVVVHVTACRVHVRSVRRWLLMRAPHGDVDTFATEVVMRHWDQVQRDFEGVAPVFRMVRSA